MSTVASFRLGWWWVTTPVSFADGPPAEGGGLVLVLSPEGADCQGGAAAAHVMHADRPGAVFRAQGRQCGGGIVTVVHRRLADAGIVQRRRNEPLSGGSDQHRISRPLEQIQSDEQRQIMLDAGLGESQTGVDDDPPGATPALSTAST